MVHRGASEQRIEDERRGVIGGFDLWTCKLSPEESAGFAAAVAPGGGSRFPARPQPEAANASAASNTMGTARRGTGVVIGINIETPNRRRQYSEKRLECESCIRGWAAAISESPAPGGRQRLSRTSPSCYRSPMAGEPENLVLELLARSAAKSPMSGA
jgi:hypothetical protein